MQYFLVKALRMYISSSVEKKTSKHKPYKEKKTCYKNVWFENLKSCKTSPLYTNKLNMSIISL